MPVRGATWHVGWQMEGPRVSGPWLGIWDYVSTRLTFCMRRGNSVDVRCMGVNEDALMRWTRSPRDLHQEQVLK